MTTAKEKVFLQQGLQNQLIDEQMRWHIAKLWLKGFTVQAIGIQVKRSIPNVLVAIKEHRTEIAEYHKDEFLKLAAERIEGFRQIQNQAWGQMSNGKQSTQLLGIINRAEENIARIQGVLSDKVHHLVDVKGDIKVYDFADNLPKVIDITPNGEGPADVVIMDKAPALPVLMDLSEILPVHASKNRSASPLTEDEIAEFADPEDIDYEGEATEIKL